MFPDTQCGIGPPTDDGFFYDFLTTKPFTPEDLVAIEKKMAHIVKQNRPIEKKLLPKGEALKVFGDKGQTLKCQLIEEKAGEMVQCYTMGPFIDFCLGPHLPSTSHIKAFKLNPSPAAAYWKGKPENPS
ncbi:MAG TPA: threonine--tRNA ligase, partial [Vicinamibacteria bacterium]|nr:threonine--tRNA ligase [Vicinamibacteria bacterium]